MRGLLYVHHCLSEGELEEATLSSLRGLVSYWPLAQCRVEALQLLFQVQCMSWVCGQDECEE